MAASDRYTGGAAELPLWARPDPALAAAGIEGEFVVARVRMIAMALLLMSPTWNVIHYPGERIHVTAFFVILAAAVVALTIRVTLRHEPWRPWIGFASSALDVSVVSAALFTFLLVGTPLNGIDSQAAFAMYFLAIGATSLRYDARICIVVGVLALGQFAGLWTYADAQYRAGDPGYPSSAGPYSRHDLFARLVLLAVATTLAVTVVRRAQRLLYLAAHDRLTGLYNRGHFDRALGAAMDIAARDGQPVSMAILDIDHFKLVNDIYGHAVGDRVLGELSRLLTRAMRHTDMVARYGGEEFVILLPATARDAATHLMETLRQEVALTPLDLGDGRALAVNFSAGIAGTPADADAITPKSRAEALLSRADARLLAAKRAGRGRCIGSDAADDEASLMAD